MARWEPGTAQRLQAAALELFASRGFEQTTAAEIAQAVGLTERSFFRHFADKREVLFDGQQFLDAAFLAGVDSAPPDTAPLAIVGFALESAAAFFPDDKRPYSKMRQTVIDKNPALQERESHKLAGLAVTMRDALHRRGIGDPTATLAAESGATVFRISFAQWIKDGETRSLAQIEADMLRDLIALAEPSSR